MELSSLLNCSEPNFPPVHVQIQLDIRDNQATQKIQDCQCFENDIIKNKAISVARIVLADRQKFTAVLRERILAVSLSSDINNLIDAFCQISCPTRPSDTSYQTWMDDCRLQNMTGFQKISSMIPRMIPSSRLGLTASSESRVDCPMQAHNLIQGFKIHRMGILSNQEVVGLGSSPSFSVALFHLNTDTGISYYSPIDVEPNLSIVALSNQRVAISTGTKINIYAEGKLQYGLTCRGSVTAFCADPFISPGNPSLWTVCGDQIHLDRLDSSNTSLYRVPPIPLHTHSTNIAVNNDYLVLTTEGNKIGLWGKDHHPKPIFMCSGRNTICTIAASPSDSRQFLTGDIQGYIRIWDSRIGSKPQQTLRKKSPISHRLQCDQNEVYSGDNNSVTAWDLRYGKPLWCVDSALSDFCIRNNNLILAAPTGLITTVSLPHVS